MVQQTIGVLIVDDHPLVRLGLRTLLGGHGTIRVLGEAASGQEAVQQALTLMPSVVLLDVRLPDISGVEVCRTIRQQNPAIKVIMLTSYADEEAVTGAAVAGASGYLLKKVWNNELVRAVELVASGGTLFDPEVAGAALGGLQRRIVGRPSELEQLSAQEKKVLALIAEAKTNAEIASSLYISEKTVRNYVSSIFRKMNFSHRAQAVVYGRNHRDFLLHD